MSIPYNYGTSFSTPTTIRAWIEYPFRNQGDSTTKVYHHIMRATALDHVPLDDDDVMTDAGEKPERSPFSDDSGAYYVGDYSISHVGDGLVEFDRQFANIPSDRTIENGKADSTGLYAFDFPATSAAVNDFESTTTTGSYSYSSPTISFSLTLTSGFITSANLAVGEDVKVYNGNDYFAFTRDGEQYSYKMFYGTIASIVGTVVTVDSYETLNASSVTNNLFGGASSFTFYKEKMPKRAAPLSDNSPAALEFRYVKSNDPFSLASDLEKKFRVIDLANVITDTISPTTAPTLDFYANLVYNKDFINAEDEQLKKWKGNIYAKVRTKIIAK